MSAHYRSVFRPACSPARSSSSPAAASGIGRCTAHELAALGATWRWSAASSKSSSGRAEIERRRRQARRLMPATSARRSGEGDGRRRPRRPRPHRRPRQQRRRPVPGAAGDDLGQGLGAVVRTNLTGGFLMARECYTQWMRGARRRHRQHRRRHVEGHAGHGPLAARRAPACSTSPRPRRSNGRRRARQRGGAGLDRLAAAWTTIRRR